MNPKFVSLLISTTLIFSNLSVFSQAISGQDSTGLPGDQFSLAGALDLFKKAASPEAFEKGLNQEDNGVNNLDLDGNGEIDYIKVIDKQSGNLHAFILQVAIGPNENQDLAVIELEKTGNDRAMLQIIGDEDLYGEPVIVEPVDAAGGAYLDDERSLLARGPVNYYEADDLPLLLVNVWAWPVVRFVYAPGYRPWISPWGYRHYPGWWRPMKPLRWNVFHPHRLAYQRHYSVVRVHRLVKVHRIYTPVRSSSVIVRTRHQTSIGKYRATRTTTTIKGKNGKKKTITRTRVRKKNR